MDDDFAESEQALHDIYWSRRFPRKWRIDGRDLPTSEYRIICNAMLVGHSSATTFKPIERFESADSAYMILRGLEAMMTQGKDEGIRRRGKSLTEKVFASEDVTVLKSKTLTVLRNIGLGWFQAMHEGK